jgi:hypothetical protein
MDVAGKEVVVLIAMRRRLSLMDILDLLYARSIADCRSQIAD